jgi:superoxide dismutase, Fe-Mn family
MSENHMMDPIPRRVFLATAAAASAMAMAQSFPFVKTASAASLTLPPLPYPENALEPFISANTISFHYGKHHKGYVDKLNELIAGGPLADAPLRPIIEWAAKDPSKQVIFNNAAQAWNHDFYWKSLKPKGGGKPTGELAEKIDGVSGGFDGFRTAFIDAGMTQFGSGWVWLVSDKGELQIMKTPNADTPITAKLTPLLTIDVWEHAYYLDYQNRRKDYIAAVFDNLLNWDFAAENLAKK